MAHNVLFFCEAGDVIEVEKCLDEGIDPNFQNSEGESPLQITAAHGYLNLVSLLLKRGALIDLSNNYGWTPLMHAAKYGHTKVVSFLLKMKAKVNIINKLGVSAVVAAACSGNLSVVKMLAEAGAMIDHFSMSDDIVACDFSTVMAASFFGHDLILQFLINNGIKADHCSSITGLTPLMLAACNGHVKAISTLVENGADIQKKDLCGRTALDLSYVFNQQDVETYLESMTSSNQDGNFLKTGILEEVKKGDILKIVSILEANKDCIRASDPKVGITPLMLASSLGQYDIVNLLISFGANLNIQDKVNGWTALMHAVSNRHADVVRLLLENGSNVNICASNGYTALDLAQHNDNVDNTIIEMLTSCLVTKDVKSPFLQSPEVSKRGRLSASERLPAKRSLSQTRVKDWIGGVAQHLQSKMLTRRSAKPSENTQSIEITVTDESANEVFLEQTCDTKNIDKESEYVMLPPDLYLASALKEHKVEALSPPFPPIICRNTDTVRDNLKKHSSDKNSKPLAKSLRLPNLLRNHIKERKLACSSNSEIGRTNIPKHRNFNNEDLTKTKEFPEIKQEPEKLSTSVKASNSFPGDLTVLLNKESLHKYADIFRNQEVDIEIFEHLTEKDLNDIGIENAESQEKLMKVIKNLQVSKSS